MAFKHIVWNFIFLSFINEITLESIDCEVLYTKASALYWSSLGLEIPDACIDDNADAPTPMPVRIRNNELVQDDEGLTRYKIRYSMEGLTSGQQNTIRESLQDLSDDVCIDYMEVVPTSEQPNREPKDVIRIRGPAAGASACTCHIGPNDDRTDRRLSLGPGCFYKGVVQHEMMHAMGFDHEHKRPDRGDFIAVHKEALGELGALGEFNTAHWIRSLDTPYDLMSTMHYGPSISHHGPTWTLRINGTDSGKVFYTRESYKGRVSAMDVYEICKRFTCGKCANQKMNSYEGKAHLEVMTRCNGTMEQYCWPSRCFEECPIEKLEGDDWYLPKLERSCWTECGSKGGRCDHCEPDSEGSDGYCCRVGSTNGDCPTEAVNLLAKKSSISALQHMCVASTRPRDLKIWHGETNIASYSIIGGVGWGGSIDAMFDNIPGDKSMYHSKPCSGDKGVVIDFVTPVQYQDVLLHTRKHCCRHRYKNVCLYADDVKLGCTPADLKEAPAVINFKDFTQREAPVIASQYRIMFEDTQCAQIEELYVQYLDVTGVRNL